MANSDDIKKIFCEAYDYATKYSTCIKVYVGSCFVTNSGEKFYSCNRGEHNCQTDNKCHKAEVTGIYESCEETRKFCSATHAEINMINILRENNINPADGTMYVTRYPCQNCLRSMISEGFKDIRFCGRSEGTTPEENIKDAKDNNVNYIWYPDYDFENN